MSTVKKASVDTRTAEEINLEAIKAQSKKIQAEKIAAKKKRLKAKSEADYIPEKGTGMMFHISIEEVIFRRGRKISKPFNQVMEYPAFLSWLRQAGSLNYAFSFLHDPSEFYTQKQNEQIVKTLKAYVKRVNFETLEFGVSELLPKQKKGLNKVFFEFFKFKSEAIKKAQAVIEEKEEGWL